MAIKNRIPRLKHVYVLNFPHKRIYYPSLAKKQKNFLLSLHDYVHYLFLWAKANHFSENTSRMCIKFLRLQTPSLDSSVSLFYQRISAPYLDYHPVTLTKFSLGDRHGGTCWSRARSLGNVALGFSICMYRRCKPARQASI